MYNPQAFAVDSAEAADAFIARYPFATLISMEGGLHVSHAPVVARREKGILVLTAHLARANPQSAAAVSGAPMTVVFHGPHAYVSPAWYGTVPAVPTWNYGTVHVSGRTRPIADPAAVAAYLGDLVLRFEGGKPLSPQTMPPGFTEKLAAGIVVFEITAERTEAKFKLGQNRSREDQLSVWKALGASPSHGDRDLARFMEEFGGMKKETDA